MLSFNRKKRSCAVFVAVICIAVLSLAACPPETEYDLAVSEITIYNIPAQIPVYGSLVGTQNAAYKIYVNASNYQADDKPPAAQGFLILTNDMKQTNGTYTVTIQLKKPVVNLKKIDGEDNPEYDPDLDPNEDKGPWKGTANNFSITISPQTITSEDGVNAIWVKGNVDLNKTKSNIDWTGIALFDFRNPVFQGPPFNMDQKAEALYTDIICRDPDITTVDPDDGEEDGEEEEEEGEEG